MDLRLVIISFEQDLSKQTDNEIFCSKRGGELVRTSCFIAAVMDGMMPNGCCAVPVFGRAYVCALNPHCM